MSRTLKFYESTTITFNDGTKDSFGVYCKPTATEAIALAHKDMGAWMVKENVDTIVVRAYNSVGMDLYKDAYIAEVKEEPAPVPTIEVKEEDSTSEGKTE